MHTRLAVIALVALLTAIDIPAYEPGNPLPPNHRAGFLLDGASNRVMNILSRNASREHFHDIVNRCVANGDDTIYLYLSNQGDGSPAPTSFYSNDEFGGGIVLAQVREMQYRLDYVRQQGLAAVAWLFADDSGSISGAPLETKKRYVRSAVTLFDEQVAAYVIALEADEHMPDDIAPLAALLDSLTEKPIGNHQLTGHHDLSAAIPQIDLHFHQYGFGRTAQQIRDATKDVVAAVGKPVIACEYSLDSDSPQARALGDAAMEAGASGTGNGRTPAPVSVAVSEPARFTLTASPNPFNGAVSLRATTLQSGPVTVAVYGVDGKLVRTLHRGALDAGTHTFVWNGRDTSGRAAGSGVYLCRLQGAAGTRVARVTLAR